MSDSAGKHMVNRSKGHLPSFGKPVAAFVCVLLFVAVPMGGVAQMPVAPGGALPANVQRPPGAAARAGVAGTQDQNSIRLNFKNNPLELVLKDYAEKTQRTILQAPNLPNVNITLESQQGLSLEEYLEAIETVLSMNQVGLLKVGEKFLKVVPIAGARQEAMDINEQLPEGGLPENDSLISQLIPLKNIDMAEAVKAITPLKHGYGQIQMLERSNSILITDAASTINRIMQIIKYVDQPIEALEEPNIVEIKYAKAADIKKKLEEIIADSKKEAQKATVQPQRSSGQPGVVPGRTIVTPPGVIRATPPPPQAATSNDPDLSTLQDVERGLIRGEVRIIADERTNILIIITRRENMTFFEKIIKVLDVETAPDVSVKVVRLEYAEAKQIAATLNTLIGQMSKGTDNNSVVGGSGDQAKGESVALREYVERVQRERDAAQSAVTAGIEKSKVGQLSSDNIKILADERTNSLLLMASRADMAALEEMIKGMDIMLSQVMIEVVVFQLTSLGTAERGVDWVQRAMVAYNSNPNDSKKAKVAFAGAMGGDNDRSRMKDPMSLTSLSSAAGVSGNLTYLFTFFDINVDAIVRLISTDNRARIMSSPRILTTDNKKATIDVTKEKYFFKGLKFVTTSSTGGGEWVDDVEMRKVGTKLSVLPHINEKKFVVLEITQTLEQEGAPQTITGAGGASEWPTIDSSDMSASVAVRSGETIVLGGLQSANETHRQNRVPVLGSIPILGNFFKYSRKSKDRGEIVVFITPYVLDTPEEIEARTKKTRDAVDTAGSWPSDSESKMVVLTPQQELDKKAAAKEETERIRKEDARKKAEQEKADALKQREDARLAVEQEKAEAKRRKEAEVKRADEEKKALSGMDPELAEFIKRQDKKFDKTLKKMDRSIDQELQAE